MRQQWRAQGGSTERAHLPRELLAESPTVGAKHSCDHEHDEEAEEA